MFNSLLHLSILSCTSWLSKMYFDFQDDNFRLYLISKLPNPEYGPEISGKTIIINYCVTEQGLQAQLLNATVNLSSWTQLISLRWNQNLQGSKLITMTQRMYLIGRHSLALVCSEMVELLDRWVTRGQIWRSWERTLFVILVKTKLYSSNSRILSFE